ncbi:MAG: (deoxy)nucleoside triphosphate pyrophosphohydrolase [Candidatus Eisenbacteria bacterium]|nr:(deoxy)nucleoside triphosphate pyrophosphohydrolase [Candidatus Eisenbacteria bacterium]
MSGVGRDEPGARRFLRVVAGVAWQEGLVLMTRRPPGGPLGLRWEFPGGKIESGESPECALEREIAEELGVGARALETLGTTSHVYPHGLEVEVTFMACALDSTEFRPSRDVHEVRWSVPAEIHVPDVLEADRAFVLGLAGRMKRTGD